MKNREGQHNVKGGIEGAEFKASVFRVVVKSPFLV